MDLHRGGGFTQGWWIYTGAMGRWIYIGAVDLHRGGVEVGGGAMGGAFTKCHQIRLSLSKVLSACVPIYQFIFQ